MRVAFYAPLKSPLHPVPSGDRQVARLFMAALESAGHDVHLASRFRCRGKPERQAWLRAQGLRLAGRLVQTYQTENRPDLWFTYHLYHKAPDWLGPPVSQALGIPYVVAEASFAPKQAGGPWDLGHRAVAQALDRTDLAVSLNRTDVACVVPVLSQSARLLHLKPFIKPGLPALLGRAALAERYGLPFKEPWILTVAMMREGDKLASYRVLGQALAQLEGLPWRLLVAGDGPARAAVEAALPADRTLFLGRLPPEDLASLYAACDLFAWPAVNEAYGMVFLEAQAAGLPVVGGHTGGVPDVVADGETGLLPRVGDADAFAAALVGLLEDADWRRAMGQAAREYVMGEHDFKTAAGTLDQALRSLVP